MDLNEILVFTRVVQAGSFIAASKALGIPKSTVSRRVAELEERLDTRLLQRTSRKLSLTDAGRIFYDHGARIASDVDTAERAVTSLKETPSGLLRITAGPSARYLSPIVREYLKRYPEVRVELFTTTRNVDLVEERFDVGIRAGRLPDSTLIAKSLGHVAWFFAATPGYFKRRGRPRSPDDLARHDVLHFGSGSDRVTIHLQRGEEHADVELMPRLVTTEIDLLYTAAVGGIGLALMPAYQCVEDLRAHRLEQVLRDWVAPPTPVHVVYPSRRHVSPAVKTFVDHLQAKMTPPPWEMGPMALTARRRRTGGPR
ncbi:MAG TPA: LysR family transcriptional regulator [Polyangiaceae bacterium]|nr:LysR family transcriptional regulator [Polyangiaceae bacterium]